MATQRIGDFEFLLNRNGRPWQAVAYYCPLYPCLGEHRRSECQHAHAHDPNGIVEQHMIDWYNNSFTQMQDRIVSAQRMRENS